MTSRDLHHQVLAMAEALEFLGGIGSSQFDLAMIDQAKENRAAAVARYRAARDAFERGGYADRMPVVDRALEALVEEVP